MSGFSTYMNTIFKAIVAILLAVAITAIPLATTTSAKAKVGEPLPHLKSMDIDGKAFDSKEMEGKTLLVDFWSITCIGCLEEMPHLVDLYNKYKDKGFVAVGINMDRSEKRVRKFIDKSLPYKMTLRTIVDKKAEIMRQLGVQMLPTTLLVDTTGKIRLFHVGYKKGYEKELEEELLKLLE